MVFGAFFGIWKSFLSVSAIFLMKGIFKMSEVEGLFCGAIWSILRIKDLYSEVVFLLKLIWFFFICFLTSLTLLPLNGARLWRSSYNRIPKIKGYLDDFGLEYLLF